MQIFNTEGFVTRDTFKALEAAKDKDGVLDTIADLIRYNTILSVARVGTGHLGASLSIASLLTSIYFECFCFTPETANDNDRDIFTLSKGHAVPALYATLAAKGFIKTEELDNLRRLGGLQGHCDIKTNGIEANTGSLAMGLSRAVGYAVAKKRFGYKGKVIAITGDGELQEGQIWEALLSASDYGLSNLYIVIDRNAVQTDQFVSDITKYNNLEQTLAGMGFGVYNAKVRSVADSILAFNELDNKHADLPKVFIADTIKGQGISFMEHTSVLTEPESRYIWHNKAPNSDEMKLIYDEIFTRAGSVPDSIPGGKSGSIITQTGNIPHIPKPTDELPVEGEPLTPAFSKALLEEGAESTGNTSSIVVFDADLEADCGLTPFRNKYPERFFEMGIMEQHMISAAAAFARMGYFPVMNSYTAFLTSRSNEQIYNYATEGGRGLFVGHMSGIIPATPGKSHQAYRDIACMKNIPGITIYQPATPNECESVLKRIFAGKLLAENSGNTPNLTYLRLSMAPPAVKLPDTPGDLPPGKQHIIRSGKDAVIIGIGPVILGECMLAAQALEKEGISVEVRNHPWLNIFDIEDLAEIAGRAVPVLVAEDHYKDGGFGEGFFAAAAKAGITLIRAEHIAIETVTTTGLRTETLRHFNLDRDSICAKIREIKG